MAASREILSQLHAALADELLRKVQSGGATAAELTAAIKFLKDNGIDAPASPGSPLDRLKDSLPSFDNDGIFYQGH